MNPQFDVQKVLACTVPPKGRAVSEHMKMIYEKIGQHIVNDAENLTKSIGENTSRIELKIIIEANSVITLENKINCYVMEE